MTNYVNPTTTDTRDLSRRQHNFGMRDAKGREHGVCVSTWSAVLEGERRHFASLQKTRDRVEFGGEAKHEHYDTAELRDHHTARLVEKLYRQREREACAACEPIGARSVEVLTHSGTSRASAPALQNLPKDSHKWGGSVTCTAEQAPAVEAAAQSLGMTPKAAGVALSDVQARPLTVAGARALLDEGVSLEEVEREQANKGYRHHARRLVARELYAGDLIANEQAAKKSKRPAKVKAAKRLERIRKRLER
ncbi:hypothetical protein JT318_gp05 [Pseudomonas phage PspYZU01]|uniref:Uncharacterized protein n=1 Tax=Pseudomonas phage PspYZU01 TaxID=1983555 RepID=A0A2U7N286_9CAUD|nr:hypothetical protein JT318_gp05 [Pseudomonas phage PspYZU01]ASD51890.1 hypothetical protein PspYZU01_05 [Pseudomonas phage PspYZU01]